MGLAALLQADCFLAHKCLRMITNILMNTDFVMVAVDTNLKIETSLICHDTN